MALGAEGRETPYLSLQENADAIFNSALVYEHAVLKNYAELALLDMTPDQPEYVEVERLLSFLSRGFAPISERDVPLHLDPPRVHRGEPS